MASAQDGAMGKESPAEKPAKKGKKRILLPVAGMAAGAALLVWWGVSRKRRARGASDDRKRARELQRDWKRAASS